MIIGTLPVVIAVVSNRRNARRDGLLPWRRLAPSLVLIGAGLLLVNRAELAHFRADPAADLGRYVLGPCWPWAPWRPGPGTRCATPTGCAPMPTAARAPGPPPRAWPPCRWRRWAMP
jgi:hypothetical protein